MRKKKTRELQGLITRTHNRFYHVAVDEQSYLCSPKGAFRQSSNPEYRLPVIGDRVRISLLDKKQRGVDGYISEILERDNRLLRADADGRRERVMAANLDRILVVSAVEKPGVDFGLIDRYILSCELAGIVYHLVINKIELNPAFIDDQRLQIYRQLEIPILVTSAKTGQGMDALKESVADGISYLSGASGVGKSTLINSLVPKAELNTGEVDPRRGRGRHTTTYSTLVPIDEHGLLVDSPGLRDFYPPRVPPEEVRFGFREIVEAQSGCRFSTCLHVEEPQCAVLDAVETGDISQLRYKSYLFLIREMQDFLQSRY